MPTNSNNFEGNVSTIGTGADATSPKIGFQYDATTGAPIGPCLVRITASPNGVISAAKGSLALGTVAGVTAIYYNTDGAQAWTALTLP